MSEADGKFMCMGKSDDSQKQASKNAFTVCSIVNACFMLVPTFSAPVPKIKHNIFALIQVVDVLAGTLRAGFVLEINFFPLNLENTCSDLFSSLPTIVGGVKKKKE